MLMHAGQQPEPQLTVLQHPKPEHVVIYGVALADRPEKEPNPKQTSAPWCVLEHAAPHASEKRKKKKTWPAWCGISPKSGPFATQLSRAWTHALS